MIHTKDGLSIGEAAAKLNLSEDTLRYYERIGLTPPVERASSGHRRYSEDDLKWFTFVIRMRATGMPIEALQHYATLVRQGEATAAERRALLEAHGRAIEAHIEELRTALDVVRHKIERIDSGVAATS